MKVVLQRVKRASVTVDGQVVGNVEAGLLLLVGIAKSDDGSEIDYLTQKIINLRIFEDDAGKMNLSCLDVGGGILAVSQFTLYGDTRKGRRPGFDQAALPDQAQPMFNQFVEKLRESRLNVETGQFGAHMDVELLNDGPVTFVLEYPQPSD